MLWWVWHEYILGYKNYDNDQAKEWLTLYNTEAMLVYPIVVEAAWVYNTNITEYNMNAMVGMTRIYIRL